jgi:Uma2 family endonuclease
MIDQPVLTRMTVDEFLALPETMQRMELINGVINSAGDEVMPAPLLQHQRSIRKLMALVESLIPNGEVWVAPTDVQLDDYNLAQPDVFWVAENSACLAVDGKYFCGAPDLVIEVFSPGTVRHDKVDKFRLYERYGVREYWMVDPIEAFVEVYRLQDERFVLQGIYRLGETFVSRVLGDKVVDTNLMF